MLCNKNKIKNFVQSLYNVVLKGLRKMLSRSFHKLSRNRSRQLQKAELPKAISLRILLGSIYKKRMSVSSHRGCET